jgi:hypothetical protein
MLRLAARAWPSWPGIALLTAIAVVPWAEHHHVPPAPRDRLLLTSWERDSILPDNLSVLVPPPHPDARDWPYGMVIGRGAPSVDPGILLWDGSPFANMLSVFFAPLSSLAGLLGT